MAKVKKEVKKVGGTKKAGFEYYIEVNVNDLVYKGEANSLTQALLDFVSSPEYPFAVKTRFLLKYGNSKVEKQLVWNVMMARRKLKLMSIKPQVAEILAGQLENNLAQ
jgi:hypothetical protein